MSWRKDGGEEEMDARPPKLGQGGKIKSIRHHQKLCPDRTKGKYPHRPPSVNVGLAEAPSCGLRNKRCATMWFGNRRALDNAK